MDREIEKLENSHHLAVFLTLGFLSVCLDFGVASIPVLRVVRLDLAAGVSDDTAGGVGFGALPKWSTMVLGCFAFFNGSWVGALAPTERPMSWLKAWVKRSCDSCDESDVVVPFGVESGVRQSANSGKLSVEGT